MGERKAAEQVLHIAAAVIRDQDGRVLLVRKTGSAIFMQPGGKVEPGELESECLVRELQEELALELAIDDLRPLGHTTAPAANEPGFSLECAAFALVEPVDPASITVQAELAEARWCTGSDLAALDAAGLLAPLSAGPLRHHLP